MILSRIYTQENSSQKAFREEKKKIWQKDKSGSWSISNNNMFQERQLWVEKDEIGKVGVGRISQFLVIKQNWIPGIRG